jgi:hypothetical protein
LCLRPAQEAFGEVYLPRVLRGDEKFLWRKFSALNANLAALALFFDETWNTPASGLNENTKARVLSFAAFALRALGRLREAVEPFQASLKGLLVQKSGNKPPVLRATSPSCA